MVCPPHSLVFFSHSLPFSLLSNYNAPLYLSAKSPYRILIDQFLSTHFTSSQTAFLMPFMCHANGAVKSVTCSFCITFGREASTSVVQISRHYKHNKVSDSFCTYLYQKHFENRHAAKWLEYQRLSVQHKAHFFN